jgi:polar amino acid transport system substrate-binding protein
VKKALMLALAAVSTLILQPAAQAQTIDEIKSRGKILVALDSANPPYGTMDKDNKPGGYDYKISEAIAKSLGVQLEIVPVSSASRIPTLVAKRADIIVSTLSITAERAQTVAFSIPYAALEFTVVAPKATVIKTPADLAGKRIAVVRTGVAEPMIVRTAPPTASIQRFEDDGSINQALLSGQVDAIATGFLVPSQLNKVRPGADFENKITLSRAHFGIGVRRDAPELLQWLNTFIYTIKTNGQLNAISEETLGISLPDLPTF